MDSFSCHTKPDAFEIVWGIDQSMIVELVFVKISLLQIALILKLSTWDYFGSHFKRPSGLGHTFQRMCTQGSLSHLHFLTPISQP